MIWTLVLLGIGFLLLIKGADYLIEGAVAIAKRFGLSELLIGLTIVAFGTSAPELAVSFQAALKGSGIALGNVLGSNIANIALILGAAALISPLKVSNSTMYYEIPFIIIISAASGAMFFGRNFTLGRSDGIVLLAFFVIFMMYIFSMARQDRAISQAVQIQEKKDTISFGRDIKWAWIATIGGLVAVIIGGDLVVDAGSHIARSFGVSDMLIGVTIVAIGTSLPELVTSITAGRKGRNDLAVGNVIGSNIFNTLFILGASALASPLKADRPFMMDIAFNVGLSIALPLLIMKRRVLSKFSGLLLVALYTVYLLLNTIAG
ncbi:MAG TPA: calcium/sodium antiporter [Mesotoga sp.]|nr:calcium/sodium antiporter [Mesotoga sp.]NLX34757.1 calcium/sodium antiporter [Thermotogaceae bacterium]MDD4041495.1 calcium/sodium antiporter [Mesotoga sp.]HOI64021.1 calcium/sodium antiporter [Mesotoga sp.]HOY25696.1 calcium/sodium antiporter [Mesotoga sp.]